MKDLLDKISSYNLFNYLLPGILFLVAIDKLGIKAFEIKENLIVGAFVAYFVGLVISRVGSIIVEPILQGVKFVKFEPYKDFLKASKEDPKLETLSEVNNMYRTLLTLFIVILGVEAYLLAKIRFNLNISETSEHSALLIGLICLFLFSYRKQTAFVARRVKYLQ